jgi:hypothetical protein
MKPIISVNKPCQCGHDLSRHFKPVYKTSYRIPLAILGISKKNLVCGHNVDKVSPKQAGFQMCCDCKDFKMDNLKYLEQCYESRNQ